MQCPRCRGRVIHEEDFHGPHAKCLLCGWRYYKPITPVMVERPAIVESPTSVKKKYTRKSEDGLTAAARYKRRLMAENPEEVRRKRRERYAREKGQCNGNATRETV